MALYLVQRASPMQTRIAGEEVLVISASSSADARALANSRRVGGGSSWADATITELTEAPTINTAGAMTGWRFIIWVHKTDGTSVDISYTAEGTVDTIDEIGQAISDGICDCLGWDSSWIGASNALLLSNTGDNLGESTVELYIYPPKRYEGGVRLDQDSNIPGLLSLIIDEGAIASALVIVFSVDTWLRPTVKWVGRT